jgi:hypothetical protein
VSLWTLFLDFVEECTVQSSCTAILARFGLTVKGEAFDLSAMTLGDFGEMEGFLIFVPTVMGPSHLGTGHKGTRTESQALFAGGGGGGPA